MKRRPPKDPPQSSEGSDPNRPVGYGNPPKRSQFKLGQSGNRNGRPKKVEDVAAKFREHFQAALSRKHRVKDGNRTRTVTSAKLGIEQLVRLYAQGNEKARRDILIYAQALGVNFAPLPESTDASKIKPDHEAVLQNYVDRVHTGKRTEADRILAPPGFLEDLSDEK